MEALVYMNSIADGFIDNVANQAQQEEEEEIKYGVWRVDPDNPNREIFELENNPYIQYREVDIEEEINKDTRREIGVRNVAAADLFDLDTSPEEKLLDPFFKTSGLACLAGGSDTGKSTFLQQLALCVAGGKSECCGFKLNTRYKRALYVSTEDDQNAVHELLISQAPALNIDREMLYNLRYYFVTETIIDDLDKSLTENPADLVIVDALADIIKGDLNSNSDVRRSLDPFYNLATKHNCLFIFLHHIGKRTEDTPPSKHNLIGSQAIEGKCRVVVEMREDVERHQYKHLCVVKGNYLRGDIKQASYKVLLDNDTRTFSNTGERVPFSELSIGGSGAPSKELSIAAEAYSLLSHGLSRMQIAQHKGLTLARLNEIMDKYSKEIGPTAKK